MGTRTVRTMVLPSGTGSTWAGCCLPMVRTAFDILLISLACTAVVTQPLLPSVIIILLAWPAAIFSWLRRVSHLIQARGSFPAKLISFLCQYKVRQPVKSATIRKPLFSTDPLYSQKKI